MIRHFLTSILVATIGCLLVWWGVSQAVSVAKQKSWPQTEATILKSRLTVNNPDDGPVIELQVSFLVNGREMQTSVFTGDFDTEGGSIIRWALDDRIPERYAIGQTLSVSYDPNNLHEARAQFDDSYFSHGFRILLILFGLVLILAACSLEVIFLFVKFQQWKVHYHLRKARRLIAEGDSILDASGGELPDRLMRETRSAAKAQLEEMETLSEAVGDEVGIFTSVFQGDLGEEPPTGERAYEPCKSGKKRIRSPARSSDRQNIKTNRLGETFICVLFATLLGALSSWCAPYNVVTLRCSDKQKIDGHIQRVLFGVIPIGEPKLITDLQEVGTEFRGQSRTQSGFLVFTGNEKTTIPAGHAILSQKRTNKYLSAPSGQSVFSDGRIIFGLYLPWIIVLWGAFVCVPLWADWHNLSVMFKDQSIGQQENKTRLSAVTQFSFGAVITWCLIWGLALVVQDIYRTNVIQWLVLLALSMVGGMGNLWRTRSKWSNIGPKNRWPSR